MNAKTNFTKVLTQNLSNKYQDILTLPLHRVFLVFISFFPSFFKILSKIVTLLRQKSIPAVLPLQACVAQVKDKPFLNTFMPTNEKDYADYINEHIKHLETLEFNEKGYKISITIFTCPQYYY